MNKAYLVFVTTFYYHERLYRALKHFQERSATVDSVDGNSVRTLHGVHGDARSLVGSVEPGAIQQFLCAYGQTLGMKATQAGSMQHKISRS